MIKKLWNIFHSYDVDGGFGDAVNREELVATVEATDEEIKDFIKKWDAPEVYEKPYAYLECHNVYALEVEVKELQDLEPYSTDPENRMNRGIQEMKTRSD